MIAWTEPVERHSALPVSRPRKAAMHRCFREENDVTRFGRWLIDVLLHINPIGEIPWDGIVELMGTFD